MRQIEFMFQTGRFHKHEPKGLVLQHASQVSSGWPYAHDKFEDEIFTECAHDWVELVQRMETQNMTSFKAMNMEEKVETIEKLAQEALRVQEEIRATETTEAQRRGFLSLEGAQRIIDQLQNDHDLVDISRILIDDPITIRGDPSVLEPIQLEEITELENPKVPSKRIISPGGISTQPEISRTPGRTSVPNPFFELITIYDEEES
jgi:hypothetical protein